VLIVGVAGGKGSGLGVQDWRTSDGVAKAMYMAGFNSGLADAGLLMTFNPKKLMEIDSCTVGWTYGQFVAVVDKYIKDNPDKWNRPLSDLAFEALVAACEMR
jgi:hypothetical protein